jgi:hypothetical protein
MLHIETLTPTLLNTVNIVLECDCYHVSAELLTVYLLGNLSFVLPANSHEGKIDWNFGC